MRLFFKGDMGFLRLILLLLLLLLLRLLKGHSFYDKMGFVGFGVVAMINIIVGLQVR